MVYIPEIVPGLAGHVETRRGGIAGDETASYSSQARGGSFAAADWVLPRNHAEIRQADRQ